MTSRFMPRPSISVVAFTIPLLGCLLFIQGCGGGGANEEPSSAPDATPGDATSPDATSGDASESSPAPTTPAPSANDRSTDSPAPNGTEEPGGLGLPPGEIPGDANRSESERASELQMPDVDPPAPENGSSGNGSTADAGSEPVTLVLASWDDVKNSVTAGGQITVIDLWSLACPPCLEEFPGLVRLHEELGDQVRCVGFDLDYDGRKTRPPESYEPKVAEFLRSVDAKFENYISRTPIDDVLADVGVVAIPSVLVFNADGELVKHFADTGETAGFTYDDDVIPFVKDLAG